MSRPWSSARSPTVRRPCCGRFSSRRSRSIACSARAWRCSPRERSPRRSRRCARRASARPSGSTRRSRSRAFCSGRGARSEAIGDPRSRAANRSALDRRALCSPRRRTTRWGCSIDAADHLALVLAVDPHHLDATKRLGGVLERLGDDRGFVRCLQRLAMLTGGDDFAILTTLGITLSGLGRHTEAIEVLKDVAARRRNVGSAYADLGLAQLTAGQHRGRARDDRQGAEPRRAVGAGSLRARPLPAKAGTAARGGRGFRRQRAARAGPGRRAVESGPDARGAAGPDRRASRAAACVGARPERPRDPERARAPVRSRAPARAARARSRPPSCAAPGMAIAGNLATTSFLDLLEFLRLQRGRGRWRCRGRAARASCGSIRGRSPARRRRTPSASIRR